MPDIRPYGSWASPISAALVAGGSSRFGDLAIGMGHAPTLTWTVGRPPAGRNVLVHCPPDEGPRDLVVEPFNVRTRVHEYGGGALLVAGSRIFFVNDDDQQIYQVGMDSAPVRVTDAPGRRFADATWDRYRQRLIVVSEDHRGAGEPINRLDAVWPTRGGEPIAIEGGKDFYASPRVSPDGTSLAWVSWNHPNMPWDGSDLWIARIARDGTLTHREKVAGSLQESVVQPEWSPDGLLHFVSDRTGFWNLYRFRAHRVEPLISMSADFARPPWTFANPTYGFASSEQIICAYVTRDGWRLASVGTRTRRLDPIDVPYTQIEQVRVAPRHVAFLGGSSAAATVVARLRLDTGQLTVVARSREGDIDPAYVSHPATIEFPTTNGHTAHGLVYVPVNPDYRGPVGERPPLRVIGHGGPTDAASRALQLAIQFWTSRGVAVLDVDYGGSSGYGRGYRERLRGSWGIVDVDDCVNGARYLAERGDVDGDRLTIRGGSAGGFTVLCALAFHDVFRMGVCYYGVSDLEGLARDTHKFESRYLDALVGRLPEHAARYHERSPIHHVSGLDRPVIFFQGLEDRVVPPNQTEFMVDALRRAKVPVAYLAFEGEQHGFRRADTIRRALEAELYFYGRVLGFEPSDELESVPIAHLPGSGTFRGDNSTPRR